MKITLYSRTHCPQCTATKRKMGKLGLEYVEINTEHDEAAAQFLRDAGYREVPVCITDDGQEWTGFRPDILDAIAERQKAAE